MGDGLAMEWRYLAGGVNVAVFSAVLLLVGYSASAPQVMGVGAAGLVLGTILVALGFTYTDPLYRLVETHMKSLLRFSTVLVEDVAGVDTSTLVSCPRGEGVVVAASRGEASCSSAEPGAFVDENGVAYVALEYTGLPGPEEGEALEEYLKRLLVAEYGACRDVVVEEEGPGVRATLLGVPRELEPFIGAPLEPVKTLLLAALAKYYSRPVRLYSWVYGEGNATATARLL